MPAKQSDRQFEKASIVLFSLMMVGNVINYVYQMAMGRLLSVSDYGTMNALQAIVTIASIPAGAFLMMSSRSAAQGITDRRKDAEVVYVVKASALFGAVLSLVGLVCSGYIARLLHVDSSAVVAIAMLFIFTNCVFSSLSGILQGKKRFVEYGVSSVVSMASKLALSVTAALIGLGLFGVMGGLVAAPLVAAAYCLLVALWRRLIVLQHQRASVNRSVFYSLGGLILLQIALAFFSNVDVILVKALYTPEVAGIYSSGMVLGKVPLFAASAIVGALYPFAAEDVTNSKKILASSLKYAIIISMASSAVICFGGLRLVSLLFGARYEASGAMLPYISVMAIAVTLVTIVANYSAATEDMRFFIISSALCIGALMVLVALVPMEIQNLILLLSFAALVTSVLNLARAFLPNRLKSKEKQ